MKDRVRVAVLALSAPYRRICEGALRNSNDLRDARSSGFVRFFSAYRGLEGVFREKYPQQLIMVGEDDLSSLEREDVWAAILKYKRLNSRLKTVNFTSSFSMPVFPFHARRVVEDSARLGLIFLAEVRDFKHACREGGEFSEIRETSEV